MRKTLIAVVCALALVFIIKSCAFTSCIVPYSGEEESLYPGDRVIVNRWSYGYRIPMMSLFGYHRLCESMVSKGDIVIFNNPSGRDNQAVDSRELFIGRCIGCPGDTLLLDSQLLCRSNSKAALPFVVPGKGLSIDVKPWNAKLLCNTMNRHEHRKARLQGENLYIDGRMVKKVTFTQDYYWMLDSNVVNVMDSRMFGFVPQDHLLGRASLIWFSHDPTRTIISGYRWNRVLTCPK